MFKHGSLDEGGSQRSLPRTAAVERKRTTTSALARAFGGLTVNRRHNETPEDLRGPLGLDEPLALPDTDPLADLIFVHGLGGGSRKTWSHGPDPTLFWPREWLPRDPEFINVRIHSFGYDSNYIKRSSSNLQIYDFGVSLLAALQFSPLIRRSKNVPIIFVAHSMGGLVAKRAYLVSQSDPNFKELGARIHAFYFLATPHHGAESAHLLSNILRVTGSGAKPFLEDLAVDSPAIQAINDEFRHYAERVHLYSFFEAQEMSVGGMRKLIVSKASAHMGLPHERVTHLDADHRGVCKFETPSDPNFIKLRGALTETLDRIREASSATDRKRQTMQKRWLKDFLTLSGEINDIDTEFEEPSADGSCEWLVELPHFQQWRDVGGSNIFWLHGSPATGKSFLARYVHEHLTSLGNNCSFFFFRAGAKIKASLAQCLLHIAYHMACTSSSVRDKFVQIRKDDVQVDTSNVQSIWKRLFLGGIFQADLCKNHYWVIDALDECRTGNQLVQLLTKLDPKGLFRVFITSRFSLETQRHLRNFPTAVYVQQVLPECTAADIRRYVENHTNFPSMEDPISRRHLTSTILRKSEGCFLWVSLVLKELKRIHSTLATQQILDDVPLGMDQLFHRTLEMMSVETYSKPLAKVILKWAACAVRALSIEELKIAIKIDFQDDVPNLEHQISELCGHLVFVEPRYPHRVRMIHETARSFLLNPENESEFAFDERLGHRDLALTCLQCLLNDDMRAPRSRRPSTTLESAQRSPFVHYAALAFYEHVNMTPSDDQELFSTLFQFLSSSHGNVLSWIEYIAKQGDLSPLMRTGIVLKTYMKRRLKDLPTTGRERKTVELWSTDLIRLVAKFGHNLRSFTPSIFHLVPPLCPQESALYQQFGRSSRGIVVHGLVSSTWGDRLASMTYESQETTALACGDTYFVIGTSNKNINLHYTSTCQLVATMPHGERIKLLEFSATGRLLASASRRYVRTWETGTKTYTRQLQTTRPCFAMTFTQDDKALVLACQDNKLHFHDLSGVSSPRVVPLFTDFDHSEQIMKQPEAGAFSLELKLFAFVYRGGHINLWNWEESDFTGTCEKPRASSQVHPFHAASLVFSPASGSDTLAAAYEGGDIHIFSPLEGSIKASYHLGHDSHTLTCSPDGRTLLSGDSSGTIRVFDLINFEDGTLKLFYVIYARGNIRSLSFFGDNLRFADIRGMSSNVWEPAALVRSECGDEVSETVSVDLQEQLLPDIPVIDRITAMTPHPAGRYIFCGTENGLVQVFSAETGKMVQTLHKISTRVPVTRIVFNPSNGYLASASYGARVIVRHLSETGGTWKVVATVLIREMNDPVEDLLFSADGTHLLVVTTTEDLLCVFPQPQANKLETHESRFVSVQWTTRNWGIWTVHPTDPSKLLLIVNGRMRIYAWDDLRELTSSTGIEKDFELPPDLEIQKVYTGWKGRVLVTEYSAVNRARDVVALFLWDTAHMANEVSQIQPHTVLQKYGTCLAKLIGSSGKMIGMEREHLFFRDHEGWICSVKMEAEAVPEHYRRHLFLPSDWLSTSNDHLIACTTKGDIIFAKDHELAVIKHGLEFTELVPFM